MNIPPQIPRVVPGKPVPTRALVRLAGSVANTARATVSAGLKALRIGGIPSFDSPVSPKFHARLSGYTSPYDFEEAYIDPTTTPPTWRTLVGGRTGSGNAHEFNAIERLDGKYAILTPVGNSWYRFAFPQRGAAHPPPACALSIRLTQCGTPISGATITGVNVPYTGAPDVLYGSTDASGIFSFDGVPAVPEDYRDHFIVAYDGEEMIISTTTNSVNWCDNYLELCYDKAKLTVTVTGDTASAVNIYNLVQSGPGTGLVETSSSAGVHVFEHKRMRYCSTASVLPISLTVGATPTTNDEYLQVCADATVNCGDDLSLTLAEYYFATCFLFGCYCHDDGCYAPGPYNRGLMSKKYQVRFTSTPILIFGQPTNDNYFGDDEGQWITLDAGVDGFGLYWDSGCLGGKNNFISYGDQGSSGFPSFGCSFNQAVASEVQRYDFGATRVTMRCEGQGILPRLTYTRWPLAGCAEPTNLAKKYASDACDINTDDEIIHAIVSSAAISPGYGPSDVSSTICVPCMVTLPGLASSIHHAGDFQVEIRETC